MKKYVIPAMLIASLTFAACGNNQESTTETTGDTMQMGATSDATPGAAMTDTSNNQKDRDFVMEAASGGLMEVELGNLAQTNASSAAVKQFGQQMVTDHSKANDELKSIASAKNITIPTAPSGKHQDHINELKSKKGAEFDKAYMSMMVDDHQEDVDKFQSEADNGNDAEIKAFAAKTVPILKTHLELAKTTKDKVK